MLTALSKQGTAAGPRNSRGPESSRLTVCQTGCANLTENFLFQDLLYFSFVFIFRIFLNECDLIEFPHSKRGASVMAYNNNTQFIHAGAQ